MLKAVFLDMDETLCATSLANDKALLGLAAWVAERFPSMDADMFCQRYLAGIYKELNTDYPQLISLLVDEGQFRCLLIQLLFKEQNQTIDDDCAQQLQQYFDDERMVHFDFFPQVKTMLEELRTRFTLVLITNGPTFSQYPKIDAVNLRSLVDAVIIGGEEPEEKPAASIFQKALNLAGCEAHEAVHVGDSLSCDIEGAQQMGIKTIWVDTLRLSDQQAIQNGRYEPDAVIQAPFEMKPVIMNMALLSA